MIVILSVENASRKRSIFGVEGSLAQVRTGAARRGVPPTYVGARVWWPDDDTVDFG
jgi:hypothetical protein